MKHHLLFCLLLTISLYGKSQISKNSHVNIITILEQYDPDLSEYIFNHKGAGVINEQTYNYNLIYGEYVKEQQPSKNYTFNYNELGVAKKDFWNMDITIDSIGKEVNKPYLKYVSNTKGQITTLFVYDPIIGRLNNRFVFIYNRTNQIITVLRFDGESKDVDAKTFFTYDLKGNRISSLTYSPHNDVNFPKQYTNKSQWIYDNSNRCVKFLSYKNEYGKWYPFGDLIKSRNGKIISKSLAENLVAQKADWEEDVLYEYQYVANDDMWSTRKSFFHKNSSIGDKQYLEVTERSFK